MANLGTEMITTSKRLPTVKIARIHTIFCFQLSLHIHIPANNSLHFFLAETCGIYQYLTRITRANVTSPITLMTPAIEKLITTLPTNNNRSPLGTSSSNHLLTTRTTTRWSKCLTGRTWTRMTLQHTDMRT
ncbi:hypothetical protein CARUB_v10010627mg [Capsella rubella]|uniref:Uncharacterized protein n=1 Tax=Capsella rubella TaxID=81985 RepID=R0IHI2_9BRAS|nr:hypothetical protein CARUB_v10010627mg [Capsella rubella]